MVGLCSSRILRANEVAERLGISRTTLWRWERHGQIPKKKQVGPTVTGLLESEIDAWWASRSTDGTPAGAAQQ